MKISHSKVEKNLLTVAILGVPFIVSLNVNFLGALGKNASFYPLFFGVLFWGIKNFFLEKKVLIPKSPSCYLFLMFLLVVIFSGVINLPSLIEMQFQGVNGADRFIVQTGALCFYFFSALFVSHACTYFIKEPISFFRHILLLSFIIPAAYSFFEILVFGGFSFAQDALASLDMIFRKVDDLYYYRIRSVTAEASAFGMYSALLFPWLLNCILHDTGSKKIFFLTIFFYFLILNLLSFSRTSYVILTIEFILYVCFFFSSIIHRVRASIGYISIGGIIFGILYLKIGEELGIDIGQIFLSLTANDGPQAMSNVARYASTLAALEIWQEYPIFGCGLGAYGFYAPGYYPNWAWSSIEIVGWSLNTLSEGSWPLAHNMYARMLAETGALGAGLWGLIGLFLIYEIWGLLKYDVNKMYVKCLLISTVGILLCGFNSESLHFFAYWIILGMVWSYRLKKMLSVSYEIRE